MYEEIYDKGTLGYKVLSLRSTQRYSQTVNNRDCKVVLQLGDMRECLKRAPFLKLTDVSVLPHHYLELHSVLYGLTLGVSGRRAQH